MYSKYQLVKRYIRYWSQAANGRGHGVHSPFVYSFIRKVLNDKQNAPCYTGIEQARKTMRQDSRLLAIEDFGAGSRVNATNQRLVSAIARSALKPRKYGRLLFRMVQYFKPENVLELGTCFGITTAYLANGNSSATVTTMEGAAQIAEVARQNFKKLSLTNIRLTEGNFDETLPVFIHDLQRENKTLDFAFIDGNHRKEPTVRYFNQLLPVLNEQSVLVFDDIHWSREMEEAWAEIQQQDQVSLSIDLFFVGIVFFRKEHKVKQHFSVRF